METACAEVTVPLAQTTWGRDRSLPVLAMQWSEGTKRSKGHGTTVVSQRASGVGREATLT